MGQPKPKIKWSCEPLEAEGRLLFRAILMWYGIEIKSEAKLDLFLLSEDPRIYRTIIQDMQRAVDEAVETVAKTITDSLDYDDEKTEAET